MPRPLWRLRVIPKTLESAGVTNIAREKLASVSQSLDVLSVRDWDKLCVRLG